MATRDGIDLSRLGARWSARRRTLWVVFLAVLVPLAVLLVLQVLWLRDLEQTSSVARVASLQKLVEEVAEEAGYYYAEKAKRALDLPESLFWEDVCHDDLAAYLTHLELDGVERLFVTFDDYYTFRGEVVVYDPTTQVLELAGDDPDVLSLHLALALWQQKAGDKPAKSSRLVVEDLDPERPIILTPILSRHSKRLGVAGLVVDRRFFEETVLPWAIEASLPRLDGRDELAVTVVDGDGRVVFPPGGSRGEPAEVESRLAFIYESWTVGIRGAATPEQWARANFVFNATLSAVLALVILGALFLALRTAWREMRLSEMKNDFVSNVSHELRTPLASIRVFGELMRLGRVSGPEKIREFGEYIENESRGLTQLINNILDFSKIESEGKIYNFEETDLEEIVAEVLKTFEVRLRKRHVHVDYRPPASPLPLLLVDPDAILQAVTNLLDNAVKYSGDSPRIALTLARRGGRVEIAVRDHGIGIVADEQEKIFERFHRVGTGLVHDVKGSGLGLAIVRHVVEAHGGVVTVESVPGRGSTFTLHLPDPESVPGPGGEPMLSRPIEQTTG